MESRDSFAFEEPLFEISIENSIRVLKLPHSIHFTFFELPFVKEFVILPFEFPLTMILSVLKLPYVHISIRPLETTVTMKYICIERSFINSPSFVLILPNQLSFSLNK